MTAEIQFMGRGYRRVIPFHRSYNLDQVECWVDYFSPKRQWGSNVRCQIGISMRAKYAVQIWDWLKDYTAGVVALGEVENRLDCMRAIHVEWNTACVVHRYRKNSTWWPAKGVRDVDKMTGFVDDYGSLCGETKREARAVYL